MIIFPFIGTVAVELLFGAALLVLGVVGIAVRALSMKWIGIRLVFADAIDIYC